MEEMSPAEALARIEQTQQKAYARQRLPLWYAPSMIAVITFMRIAFDSDDKLLNLGSLVLALAAFGAIVAVLKAKAKVMWTPATWTGPALTAYVAWAALIAAVGFGTHALASSVDEPWRKLLAGLIAIIAVTATTRPVEQLILHLSQGKVAR